MVKFVLRGACALLFSFTLVGCSDSVRQTVSFAGATMGTTYSVKIVDFPVGVNQKDVAAGIEAVLKTVNNQMSTYIPTSELSRFNTLGNSEWFPVSSDLALVVAEAQQVSVISEGLFDVTVGPLVNLWGFGPEKRDDLPPRPEEIEQRKARIGYAKLSVQQTPPALRKAQPDMYVDLSALAKGFAVDKVAEYIETQGSKNLMVEIGGEIKVLGFNAENKPWRLGVEKPLPGVRDVARVLELSDSGVATSGDYRNYFESKGKRYSHEIDPRTGYPVSHNLVSVTVLDGSTMRADAYATMFMVMGAEEGLAFAERNRIAAMFITESEEQFKEVYSTTFKARLKL